MWVDVPTQLTLPENANVSQATYFPGNFENVFCPRPTQGGSLGSNTKVAAKQYCLN
jgi:hypothetical protein